jgi:hypothetical protein
MAQRQRAGLITPRSLDRNGLPVYFFKIFNFKENSVSKFPISKILEI